MAWVSQTVRFSATGLITYTEKSLERNSKIRLGLLGAVCFVEAMFNNLLFTLLERRHIEYFQ